MSALATLDPDVTRRNNYMNTRDRYVYQSGLYDDLDIEGWFAEYNYLERIVDIHSSQLMGRPFNVYSYYDKEDLTPYEGNPGELKLAELRNKKAKANADMRKKAVDAIIRDNGGEAIYKDGARMGSVYGLTAYKQWFDKDAKKIKQVLIESPQNLYVAWADTNFRDYDWIAYVEQMSADQAQRKYGSKLPDGATFQTSKEGTPIGYDNTSDPLNQTVTHNDGKPNSTDRDMVTLVDLSGFLPGWTVNGTKLVKVPKGQEKRLSLMIVGGQVVQAVGQEKFIPNYYLIDNRRNPRRANGASDLSQSVLDINKEIVQLEADERRWIEKNLFNLIEAKGFTAETIPKKKPRKQQVVPMSPEQSLSEMTMSPTGLDQLRQSKESKLSALVRIAGVSRVLFDDPTVDANSNQALMTTMKPVIDIVEDKQSRWTPKLQQMFTDALVLSAQFIPELKEAINDDSNWYLCIEWPSVLRREDSTYQTMWINRLNANSISLETYMEKMGDDYSEEIDRIRDELKDPVVAALYSHQLPLYLQSELSPIPAPPVAAPGAPAVPGDTGLPTLTPDQNTAGPISQPGSGATSATPEGAAIQVNQNAGV